MKAMYAILLLTVSITGFYACNKAFVIENVNYTQNVESVLIPNDEDVVTDVRNNISFSIKPLLYKEFGKNSSNKINEIRLIRNQNGYYFITAKYFKNVYVFEPKENQLKLKEAITISEYGLDMPVFNWRNPYVEIFSVNDGQTFYITEKGIISNIQEEQQL